MNASNLLRGTLPALLASILLLAAGGCSSKGESGAARTGAAGAAVKGVIVRPEPLENAVRSSGTILASESVDLAAETAGRVDSIPFREGAHVNRNDLLVKINDDDLRAQLRKIELQIQLATDQESRQHHLFEISAISREDYDIALNQLNSYKADRDNLLAAIRRREIRSPFDGVVGLRYVSVGSYVSPATRIASVQKVDPLKVDFAIPEKYAGAVRVGEHAADIVAGRFGEFRRLAVLVHAHV